MSGSESEESAEDRACKVDEKALLSSEAEFIVTAIECQDALKLNDQRLLRHTKILANALGVKLRGDEPPVMMYDKFTDMRPQVFQRDGQVSLFVARETERD